LKESGISNSKYFDVEKFTIEGTAGVVFCSLNACHTQCHSTSDPSPERITSYHIPKSSDIAPARNSFKFDDTQEGEQTTFRVGFDNIIIIVVYGILLLASGVSQLLG
jgi:hypothetical protein